MGGFQMHGLIAYPALQDVLFFAGLKNQYSQTDAQRVRATLESLANDLRVDVEEHGQTKKWYTLLGATTQASYESAFRAQLMRKPSGIYREVQPAIIPTPLLSLVADIRVISAVDATSLP